MTHFLKLCIPFSCHEYNPNTVAVWSIVLNHNKRCTRFYGQPKTGVDTLHNYNIICLFLLGLSARISPLIFRNMTWLLSLFPFWTPKSHQYRIYLCIRRCFHSFLVLYTSQSTLTCFCFDKDPISCHDN